MTTETIKSLDNTCSNRVIIDSYIHSTFRHTPSPKLIDLCSLFTFGLSSPLKFSSKFKSQKGLQLSPNNHCVTKLNYPRSSWIVCDIKPVFTGIHCWRLLIDNPKQEYLKLGVSSKMMFNDSDLNQDTVWGIARYHHKNRNYYKPLCHKNRNNIDLSHFMQKKCIVDILLDIDQGILRLAVMGMVDNEHEALLWGMPIKELCPGWVPHFIFGTRSTDTKLCIMSIDNKWYGKDISNPLDIFHKHYPSETRKMLQNNNNKNKTKNNTKNGWMFYCVGIRKPKGSEAGIKLFENIDTTSIISIQSSLTSVNNIADLKRMILNTYNIPSQYDILIIYGDKIVSYDNKLKLSDFGITDRSLLLVAICTDTPSNKRRIDPGYYEMKMCKTKGFDIIMQEENVDVYTMPICGHEMNKESLYQYAMNTFKDPNNLCLKCPHEPEAEEIKSDEWACYYCTYLNPMHRTRCEMCENTKIETPKKTACGTKWNYSLIKQILSTDSYLPIDNIKLEFLLSRNKVQKECEVQRCPQCHTLHFKHNAIKLSNIKTINDIQKQFRTQCILCNNSPKCIVEKQVKWRVGEECEIYTRLQSRRNWVKGMIVKQYSNAGGEWLKVEYHNKLTKELEIHLDKRYIRKLNAKRLSVVNEYGAAFCWCCGCKWEYQHICKSRFKMDLVDILSKSETKQIGNISNVPSIRCCPNCCQLITHTDACKHILCISCKTNFCFVCLKPKLNGNWQCGSYSYKCSIAARQNTKTLPNNIVINKKSFQLY